MHAIKQNNHRTIDIWCTLGPSSLHRRVIKRLEEIGVSMFRINLSHTNVEDIEKTVLEVKKYTSVPICLDTEGPQVRSGVIKNGKVFLKANSLIKLTKDVIPDDPNAVNLKPANVFDLLNEGDLISMDLDSALLKVIRKKNEKIDAKVIIEGWVFSNRAVTIDKAIELPILSEKDFVGIELIKKYNMGNVSLSFANNRNDVVYARSIVGPNVFIISKIETYRALTNLESITEASDAILIDRGDLSREEPINKIPLLQKEIIGKANKLNRKVFVATNILESMVNAKKPLRSEVNDIMTTLIDGADGLVLAAETAIGKYPAECANMVKRMIKYYEISENEYSIEKLLKNDSFLLIEPHGGSLVNRYDSNSDLHSIENLPKLTVDEFTITDVEQMAMGTYSPLQGFMVKEELREVLENNLLPEGYVWTLPIILQIPEKVYRKLSKKMDIALVLDKDNKIYANLNIMDMFTIDLNEVARKWFGTDARDHPRVNRFFNKGEYCIGGPVTLVRKKPSLFKEFEYTPRQMRIILEHMEWSKVGGIFTNKIVNRAYEHILAEALEKYNFDGLLLYPIVGPQVSIDFLPKVINDSYNVMFESILNQENRFIFTVLSGYSHFAGAREEVFKAICRKNYGCNQYFVRRSVANIGSKDVAQQTMALFDNLDVGIKPILLDSFNFCKQCERYVEFCDHDNDSLLQISSSDIRKIFLEGKSPPEWYLNKHISRMVINKIKNGERVFFQE